MKYKPWSSPLLAFFFFVVCAMYCNLASAQISFGGTPPSFKEYQTLRSQQAIYEIPVNFDVEELKQEDEEQSRLGAPAAIAKQINVLLNPSNSGAWSVLPDGQKIWQLQLQAKGAIALMLYYADFYIPEGGKLFIYNPEKSQLLGAYTKETHPSGGRFATEFVSGDILILEYESPASGEWPRIEIEAVGYGYNYLERFKNGIAFRRTSSPCEVNVNCEEGDAWQNQKKGICQISQIIGGRTYMCSGSLINNTAQDLKPYILTAQHCCWSGSINATPEEMEQWVFYFHKEKMGCEATSPDLESKSIVGCWKIAETLTNKQSDGLLVLIKNPIPLHYQVYFNGWDRRNQPAQSGVSIHHPQGDYKKISTFNKPLTNYTYVGDGMSGDVNAHWNVSFIETLNGHGITESGSSGSPIFNENKLIVGTLTGGNSTCSNPTGLNLYGKMSYHWNKYTQSDATRMDKWLDPIQSGVEMLAGCFQTPAGPAPTNLKAVFSDQKVNLTWSAPNSQQPQRYNVYRDNLKIGETSQVSFADPSPKIGFQTYSVAAVYANGIESAFINVSITLTEYKEPQQITVSHTTTQKVAILWKAPTYEQTVYWGESTPQFQVSMDGSKPFYFGQQWSKEEIQMHHKKQVSAVKFVPIRNNTYEIYIKQGNRSYKQAITNTTNGKTNTIELQTPFVIDGTQSLIVSIYVSKHAISSDQYPAVCDAGPAIQGKGNIYSYDGNTWENLYNPEKPDEFNYNFFIAAIIVSKEGEIPPAAYSSTNEKRITPLKTSVQTVKSARFATDYGGWLRSLEPTEFPAITGYTIYRNNEKIATVGANQTRYIDESSNQLMYYQVSALYGPHESKRSDSVAISPLSNSLLEATSITISPILFTNQVQLNESDQVKRLEVYAASGKLCLQFNNPESIIPTESLQPGIYFFRVYTNNNEAITIQGVKKSE